MASGESAAHRARKSLGLGVELGMREGPEVAQRQLDEPLEVIRRGGSAQSDAAEHDERGRSEANA